MDGATREGNDVGCARAIRASHIPSQQGIIDQFPEGTHYHPDRAGDNLRPGRLAEKRHRGVATFRHLEFRPSDYTDPASDHHIIDPASAVRAAILSWKYNDIGSILSNGARKNRKCPEYHIGFHCDTGHEPDTRSDGLFNHRPYLIFLCIYSHFIDQYYLEFDKYSRFI
jgi:hypothetical protein